MKEKLREERAIDTVGRPGIKGKTYGKYGGETGKSEKKGMGDSANGVGGGLHADFTKDEPIIHEAAYRAGKDNNYEKKAETGTPRQEATYQNRDRQGSGINHQPKFQDKLPSYPKNSPKTKQSSEQDD